MQYVHKNCVGATEYYMYGALHKPFNRSEITGV